MSHSLHLFGAALLALLCMTGCPEPSETASTGGGPTPNDPGNNGNNGGNQEGPGPHSNPNDARFSVTPGQGVKIQGTFQYEGDTKGSYRIDFQKQEGNAPPMLVHAIELDKPGPFSIEVPKDYGPIYLTGFVDLKGDGPSADDPVGRTAEPIQVGSEDVTDIILDVAVGNSLGVPPQPPQPGQGPSAGDPAANGQPGDPQQPPPPPGGGSGDPQQQPPPPAQQPPPDGGAGDASTPPGDG